MVPTAIFISSSPYGAAFDLYFAVWSIVHRLLLGDIAGNPPRLIAASV
jgi:hypothetical protein